MQFVKFDCCWCNFRITTLLNKNLKSYKLGLGVQINSNYSKFINDKTERWRVVLILKIDKLYPPI